MTRSSLKVLSRRVARKWHSQWMGEIAANLKKYLKVPNDYRARVEPGRGPRIFVTVEDAEGDLAVVRELQPQIQNLMRREVRKENPALSFRLHASNKDDDLVFTIEVVVP